MDLAAILNLVSTLAVVAGLVFAGLQVRIAQQQRKLKGYIEDMRSEQGVDTPLEFFQFLAEQMIGRQSSQAPKPAFLAYRDWRP